MTDKNTNQTTELSTTKPVITISSQPLRTISVKKGNISKSIKFDASVAEGTVKYQWAVSKNGKNPPTGTITKGETKSTFKLPRDLKAGTYYYFCIITADGASEQRTNITKVVVK